MQSARPQIRRLVSALSVVALVAASSASAATLVRYEMAELPREQVSFTADFISATSLTTHRTTLAFASTHSTNSLGFRPADGFTQSTVDLATTLTNGTYVSFTLTPDEDRAIALESLTFGAYAAGASTRSFYVFSSVTGFDAGDVLLSETYSATSTGVLPYSISLSSLPGFQHLTEAVEFRIYVQTPATGASINFSNIMVNGSLSAVPEPSSAALLAGVVSLGLVALRRRSTR